MIRSLLTDYRSVYYYYHYHYNYYYYLYYLHKSIKLEQLVGKKYFKAADIDE